MAAITEQLKSSLKLGLDTAHLVLVQNTPLSIRFRFDERRFDVDGAYDIRHDIVKSRLDKAQVKGGKERLTQPGKIAIVYSHPEEASEMYRHIQFMQAEDYLREEIERLELEDLPGVQGLKALRVSVNLQSEKMLETSRFARMNEMTELHSGIPPRTVDDKRTSQREEGATVASLDRACLGRDVMKNPFISLLRSKHVCPWWLCFTFDNFLRPYFHDPEKMLKGYIREGDTVLDVGPGMGYFTIPMARMVGETGKVIAADVQQRMLTFLESKAEKVGLARRIEPRLVSQTSLGIRGAN